MTLGAAYIRGLTGFGMAIILVPLFGMIVTPGQAVVIAILLQVLIGPVGLKAIFADAHRQSALMIAAFAMLATPIGVLLLKVTTPDVARLMIAAIAIGVLRDRTRRLPANRQHAAPHAVVLPAHRPFRSWSKG